MTRIRREAARAALLTMALLASGLPLEADGGAVESVRAALARLTANEPLALHLTASASWEQGKPGNKEEGRAELAVVAGSGGISVTYPPALITQMKAEAANNDPEVASPAGRLMTQVDALMISELVDYAPVLLHQLDRATLVGEKRTVLEGRPVRELSFKLEPAMSAEESKRAGIMMFNIEFAGTREVASVRRRGGPADRRAARIGREGLRLGGERQNTPRDRGTTAVVGIRSNAWWHRRAVGVA